MAGGDGSVAYVIKATRTLPHVQTLHLRSGGLGGSVEEIRSYLDALDYIASQLSSVSPVSSFYHFTISLFSYSLILLFYDYDYDYDSLILLFSYSLIL